MTSCRKATFKAHYSKEVTYDILSRRQYMYRYVINGLCILQQCSNNKNTIGMHCGRRWARFVKLSAYLISLSMQPSAYIFPATRRRTNAPIHWLSSSDSIAVYGGIFPSSSQDKSWWHYQENARQVSFFFHELCIQYKRAQFVSTPNAMNRKWLSGDNNTSNNHNMLMSTCVSNGDIMRMKSVRRCMFTLVLYGKSLLVNKQLRFSALCVLHTSWLAHTEYYNWVVCMSCGDGMPLYIT